MYTGLLLHGPAPEPLHALLGLGIRVAAHNERFHRVNERARVVVAGRHEKAKPIEVEVLPRYEAVQANGDAVDDICHRQLLPRTMNDPHIVSALEHDRRVRVASSGERIAQTDRALTQALWRVAGPHHGPCARKADSALVATPPDRQDGSAGRSICRWEWRARIESQFTVLWKETGHIRAPTLVIGQTV
jgi:hypothetical protein